MATAGKGPAAMHRNLDCSEEEWQARHDLAACDRVFALLGSVPRIDRLHRTGGTSRW